jgi:hypothetical protein
MILTGVFIGLATSFKQVAAAHWPFLVMMYPIFVGGEKRFGKTIFFAAWSAAGAIAVWVLIGLYFVLRHGFQEFIYNVFTHNMEYINALPLLPRVNFCLNALRILSQDQILIWLLSITGFIALARTGRLKVFLFFAGWMIASWIGVSASGNYFPHYFQQIVPVLCLTAVIGAEALAGGLGALKTFSAWQLRAALGLSLVVLPAIVIYPYLFIFSPAEAVSRIYPGNRFAEMRDIGARIAQVTSPNDRVFVFGAEPEVLFYAQRVSATRYIFLFPLYGPYSDAKAKQVAAANEITRNHPAAILCSFNGLFLRPGSEQYFNQWALSYLAENFRADTYMTIDPAGVVRIDTDVTNQNTPTVNGQQTIVIVEIDVRKNAEPSAK